MNRNLRHQRRIAGVSHPGFPGEIEPVAEPTNWRYNPGIRVRDIRRGPDFYTQDEALRQLNEEEERLNNPRIRSNSPASEEDVPELENVSNERLRHGYLSLIYGQNRLNMDTDAKTKIQLSEVYNNLKQNIPKQWRVEELSREVLIKNGK